MSINGDILLKGDSPAPLVFQDAPSRGSCQSVPVQWWQIRRHCHPVLRWYALDNWKWTQKRSPIWIIFLRVEVEICSKKMPGNLPQEYPISLHTGRQEFEGVATNLCKIEAGRRGNDMYWFRSALTYDPQDRNKAYPSWSNGKIHIPNPELYAEKHQGMIILYKFYIFIVHLLQDGFERRGAVTPSKANSCACRATSAKRSSVVSSPQKSLLDIQNSSKRVVKECLDKTSPLPRYTYWLSKGFIQ